MGAHTKHIDAACAENSLNRIAEGLVMAAYYLSDMLNGLIFYTLLWILFNFINKSAFKNSFYDIIIS